MAEQTTVDVSCIPEIDKSEQDREDGFLQLRAKLERGVAQAERGELLDGDEVFGELRDLIDVHRSARQNIHRP